MSKADKKDIAGVIAPPPLFFLAAILVGLGLEWAVRADIGLGRAGLVIGLLVVAEAVAIAVWGRQQFVKGGTSLRAEVPSTAILSMGPFRFSRNPLYVSMASLQIGIGIAASMAWVIVLVIPALLVIRYGVIAREERYLEGKFGDEYLRYKNSVRRWI